MILYILIAVVLLVMALLALLYRFHLSDKNKEAAEIARFGSLSKDERLQALQKARRELRCACARYAYLNDLWCNYKWGFRQNPYAIPRFIAALECASAQRVVQGFESML